MYLYTFIITNTRFNILRICCGTRWRTWCRSCEYTLIYYNTDYRLEHWMCDLDIDIDTTKELHYLLNSRRTNSLNISLFVVFIILIMQYVAWQRWISLNPHNMIFTLIRPEGSLILAEYQSKWDSTAVVGTSSVDPQVTVTLSLLYSMSSSTNLHPNLIVKILLWLWLGQIHSITNTSEGSINYGYSTFPCGSVAQLTHVKLNINRRRY